MCLNKLIHLKTNQFYGLCLNLMHDHKLPGIEQTGWQLTAPKNDAIPDILNSKLSKEKYSLWPFKKLGDSSI